MTTHLRSTHKQDNPFLQMLNIQNTYTKSPLLECAPQDDDDDDGRKGEHTRPCLKTNLHARK